MISWPLAQTPARWLLDPLAGQAADTAAELPTGSAWPFVAGLCGIAAVFAVWAVASWYLHRRKAPTIGRPWSLFFQLARAHRLAWRDIWLLYRLACRLKLTQPALLFVQPENFAPVRLEGLRADRIARLTQLRHHLFEGLGERAAADGQVPPSHAADPAAAGPGESEETSPLAQAPPPEATA